MKNFRYCLALLVIAACVAQARVVRVQIASRELVADGASFGASGPYEKLRGTALFEVDPADFRNAVIFDLDKAPRNQHGMVEFSADIFILKPVEIRRGNGGLFVEPPNRGLKLGWDLVFQDAPSDAALSNPTSARDFGNGFLLRRGYTLVWVGWSPGLQPGADRITAQFPQAMENGQSLTGMVVAEYFDGNFGGGKPFTLPLSGNPAYSSYEAVSTDPIQAQAELRVRSSDSFRFAGAEIPEGSAIPTSEWSFAACPTGPPGNPSTKDICLAGGFQNDKVYELVYTAKNPIVSGLAYATTRDFVSFLRAETADLDGNPNPVSGISTVLCHGTSIAGQYLRDFIYQGFNEDEQGRRVCDGVNIHVAGAQRSALNYRFARDANSAPFWGQHAARNLPDVVFPWTYGPQVNRITGKSDAILKRPDTDPKVMHTDSSTEYWQRRSSLLDADEQGVADIVQPENVRKYVFAGTQHLPAKGMKPDFSTGNRKCQQLSNPTHDGIVARALLVALDDWVRNSVEPPPSQAPRIDNGTLVPSDRESTGFPNIPGVVYSGLLNGSGERDFGARVYGNRGIIDNAHPKILSTHRVLAPRVDQFGIDIAGVRSPFVEAVTATVTGWNLRRTEFTDGDLCDSTGMMIPLAQTLRNRLETGDPRPSLEELYVGHRGYVFQVAGAALRLYWRRFMLLEDVLQVIREADESDVLR